jgi:hypothetical protein
MKPNLAIPGDSLNPSHNLILTAHKPAYVLARTLVLLFLLTPFVSTSHAQGNLTPPGPPGATMKSLSQIEPRVPISSLPCLISNSGAYYITTNLTGTAGTNGITVAANDVSLDLSGFALIGVSGSLDGIRVGLTGSDTYTNIAVFNGTIRNWDQNGFNSAYSCYNARFERLQVAYNKGGGLVGYLFCLFRDCQAITNSSSGLTGYNSIFESCNTVGNSGDGIYASGGRVINCSSSYNAGAGVRAFNGGMATGCLCSQNARSGIAIGTDSAALGNTCVGNNTSGNGVEAGILAFFGPGRIEGNHVSYGMGYGIMVSSGQTRVVVVKNTTAGNTNNIYSIPAGNDVGPWGKAATNTSPWANIYN